MFKASKTRVRRRSLYARRNTNDKDPAMYSCHPQCWSTTEIYLQALTLHLREVTRTPTEDEGLIMILEIELLDNMLLNKQHLPLAFEASGPWIQPMSENEREREVLNHSINIAALAQRRG